MSINGTSIIWSTTIIDNRKGGSKKKLRELCKISESLSIGDIFRTNVIINKVGWHLDKYCIFEENVYPSYIINKKLEKYLIKRFFFNFILFILLSLFILFLIEFVELLRRTSENPNISSVYYILYLALLKITESIVFIIPIAIFVTTKITCRSFNRHREMIIIQNTGLHSFKILYPFIFFAFIFCIIYFVILNPFFSHATNSYQKIEILI